MDILIVEDEMVSRKLLEKILSKHGTCDFASRGDEALNAVIKKINQNEYYDLICLDLMMPKIDGISVLSAIRDLEKQHQLSCKIMLITAMDEIDVVKDAFEQGADAYVTKPIDLDKLDEILTKFGLISS